MQNMMTQICFLQGDINYIILLINTVLQVRAESPAQFNENHFEYFPKIDLFCTFSGGYRTFCNLMTAVFIYDFADNGITVTGVYPDGREFDKFLILPDGSIKEVSTTLVKKQGN